MIWRRMRVVEADVEFYDKLNHVARSTSLHPFPGGLVRSWTCQNLRHFIVFVSASSMGRGALIHKHGPSSRVVGLSSRNGTAERNGSVAWLGMLERPTSAPALGRSVPNSHHFSTELMKLYKKQL